MTIKEFEKFYKVEVVERFNSKLILTKEIAKINNYGVKRYYWEYKIWKWVSIFGLFGFWRTYTRITRKELFEKWNKLKKKYSK